MVNGESSVQKMPNTPAINRFNKLIDDISRLYLKARNAQVEFALEVGRRLVEEEQNGAARARRGAGLIHRVSKVMTQRYGAGFSESNLLKMRRFFLLNPYQSISTDMDWSSFVGSRTDLPTDLAGANDESA